MPVCTVLLKLLEPGLLEINIWQSLWEFNSLCMVYIWWYKKQCPKSRVLCRDIVLASIVLVAIFESRSSHCNLKKLSRSLM